MRDEISQELFRIANKNGGVLKAEDVVKAAKTKTSILHEEFEWDDTEAAEQYRLQQARHLIRVTIQYVGPPDKNITTRVFVSLPSDRANEGGGYRTITSVVNDPAKYAELLEDAKAEMQRFRYKYSKLSELAEVFAAMDRVGKRDRVDAD
jgi:hypothetical protein